MGEPNKREMYCKTFECDPGKFVLDDLKKFTGFESAPFVPDPQLAAYMQGRRSVLCEILNNMKGCKIE